MRLARYLSQCGVASRRKAEVLIEEGRVHVNGKVVRKVATNVEESDRVKVDGQGVTLEDFAYVILNKPKGCISTVSDPEGRTTVMDYLPKLKVKVKPVGRLDFNSEGVLLMTNDGELAAKLLSAKNHVEKTYHVKIYGQIRDFQIEKLRRGVKLDDGTTTKKAQVDRLKARSKHDWLVMTLVEGKNRQIHRMLEALRLQVSKIQRVAFGGLTYHGLRVGDARELDQSELSELRKLAGVKASPRSDARGKWSARREDTDRLRKARARAKEEAETGEVVTAKSRAKAKAKAKRPTKPTAATSRRGRTSTKKAAPKRGTTTKRAAASTKKAAPKRGSTTKRAATGAKKAAPKRGSTTKRAATGTKKAAPKRGSTTKRAAAGRRSPPKRSGGPKGRR